MSKEREWNALLELQLANLRSLYDELNDAVVGYLEMRVEYQDLLPHLRLGDERRSERAALMTHEKHGKLRDMERRRQLPKISVKCHTKRRK